ncbi:hypothetical protein GGI15_002263 [Coemansia interrupta]|uniref:Histone-lysine N-methyltransferase n=1 Tax=Coemansia interrupta TaxID=1126814 RepID=A0A9W8HMF0_9FUNG|nr:hypothetical protein GGI15_002263 [Coemansia interrupta]
MATDSRTTARARGDADVYTDESESDGRNRAAKQKSDSEAESEEMSSYEVEAIVDDRISGGTKFYHLKWVGYSTDDNTWEPIEHLDCLELIRDYESKKNLRKMSSQYRKGFPLSKVFSLPKCHDIWVVNTVDNAKLPEDFVYTDGYIRGKNVPYPSGVVFPCSCTGEKCGPSCECVETPCYDENGRICVDLELPIHECNYLCKCSIKCPNRTVQRGNNISIDIVRTVDKGWGAITRKDLHKGDYICRYTGELITYDDSTKIDVADTTYLFDLDSEVPSNANGSYVVDACKYGNVSHFFNHSCDPNLVILSVYINHIHPLMHELAFFALKDIKAGEELTFNYSPLVELSQQYKEDLKASTPNDKQFKCFCGAATCRKVIFPNARTTE